MDLEKLIDLANPKIKTKGPFNQREKKDEFYWSSMWRKMSRNAKRRDHNECQVCRGQGKVSTSKLIAHHVNPIEFYPEHATDMNNIITVCDYHHKVIHKKIISQECEDEEWW